LLPAKKSPLSWPASCTNYYQLVSLLIWTHQSTKVASFNIFSTKMLKAGWPLSRQCEIPWRFAALLRGTRRVKCYSYQICSLQ